MTEKKLDEYEYHLFDELRRGNLSRRDFIRRASIMGVGLSTVGAILAADPGLAMATPVRSLRPRATPTQGGTARIGITVPTASPEPVSMYDEGGIITSQIAGEYLCWPLTNYNLVPRLATSWSSTNPKTWTFKIRQGVKFHNGQALTAADVVATFERLVAKAVDNSALSGVLLPGQTEKVDDFTVTFHLAQPFVDFPYLVSGFNYNAIILPATYQTGDFIKGGSGTGAFKVGVYTAGQNTTYTKNSNYWASGLPYLDGITLTYYQDNPPEVLAMEGGNLDVLPIAPYGSQALYAESTVTKLKAPSSGYRTLQMRTDEAPWSDVRVRQALAYTLNRPQIITGLLSGFGEVGNDHAFAPVFPLSKLAVKDIPQRTQNIAKAKALLAAAGHPHGINATLTTENYLEIPGYATIIKQQAQAAGFNITLKVEPQSAFYGSGKNQPWLSVPLGITDWGARGVPSQTILPAYTSTGVWNSAHWKDPQFDKLMTQLNSTLDETSRQKLALQAATVQHNAVPDIIAYWFVEVRITGNNVHGLTAGPAEWLDPRAMWLST